MGKSLYVGNVAYSATDDDLRKHFESKVTVERSTVVLDKETRKSRGFGFVEVPDAQLNDALQLDGSDLLGRSIRVNEARPREPRGDRDNRRRRDEE